MAFAEALPFGHGLPAMPRHELHALIEDEGIELRAVRGERNGDELGADCPGGSCHDEKTRRDLPVDRHITSRLDAELCKPRRRTADLLEHGNP